jgi:hypothetical protein
MVKMWNVAPLQAAIKYLGGRSQGIGRWPQPSAMLGQPVGSSRPQFGSLEVSKEPVPMVEAHGVGAQQPFHAGHEVGGQFPPPKGLLIRQNARMALSAA